MALVITAPNPYPADGLKIYLAGSIDMGTAVDWQNKVITALKDEPELVIINPRRAEFTPAMEEEQIHWELQAIEDADYILMWLPQNTEAPVSFLEFGLYLRSGKLIVGVEEGFYRQKNIEITAQHYGVDVFHNLNDVISQLQSKI